MSSLLFVSNDFWLKSVVPYFGVIAGVTFAGTFFYWQWFSAVRDQKAGGDFYTTAGQILPVFLLAALIDARQTRDTSRTQTATYFGVIAIGELMALYALAFDVRSSITFAPVAASVSAALLGLTCALLARK